MKSLPATSKIKIAERMSPRPSSEELRYLREMRINAASIWTTIEDANYDYIVETRHLLEQHGILLWNIGILDLHCDPTMVLGLPGFDEKIAQYKDYLRDLGRACIGYTTYAHMANIKLLPYYQTAVGQTRGIPTREFDHELAKDLPLSNAILRRRRGLGDIGPVYSRSRSGRRRCRGPHWLAPRRPACARLG